MIRRIIALFIAWHVSIASGCIFQRSDPPKPLAILVFTKTAGFRHDSIPDGIDAVRAIAQSNRFKADFSEEADTFNDESLRNYRAVMFLNTSGDVLNEHQQNALIRFIQSGGGFIGVHAAADTEHEWDWYGQMLGAQFKSHPEIQRASVIVLDRTHASTRQLPLRWDRTDEWYNFDQRPSDARILAVVDESTYQGGTMDRDHPISWCHEFEGGRIWYTGMGHTAESYREPHFLNHVLGGIRWSTRSE